MRCLLVSWGSCGDLHPFLALGGGLSARGHAVTLVGHPEWAAETEAAGLRFVATDEPPRDDFAALHPEIMSARWGGLSSLRALVRYGMEPSFEPILAAVLREAPGHDVIVAHHFIFSAPVAAALTGRPLVTVVLAPGVEPSAYSRPGPNFGRAGHGLLARALNRIIWLGGRMVTRLTVDPAVNRLRRRHGLRPVRHAVFSIPAPSLRLYSEHFAPRPPDWSADRQPIGFCFYDPPAALPPEVEKFLAAGAPPILFTLGSAAVQMPGEFYRNGAEALRLLGWRGIFLIGAEKNRPPHLSDHVLAIPYAPFGTLMPRVRAAVHQGGVGTLSHALRAGLPSVACPFAFDQPNNARRLEALGVAEVLPPHRRSVPEMAGALRRLLAGEAPPRARRLAGLIRAENGVARACTRLEEMASTFS
jgi:UDP:flavonoid glycosyltransferase YjiC (YdhE family)